MRALFNLILVVSLALQGMNGFSFQNFAKAQNLALPQSVAAEMEKPAPVPLLADVLKDQQTNTPAPYAPGLRLKADPQLIIPGVPVSVEWTVGQWNSVSKRENLKAIVQFPNDVTTSETAALNRGKNNTSMVLPQAAANGKAGFRVNSQTKAPFLIDVQIKAGGQEIATNSVLMTTPSLKAIAGKDNHLVSKDGKVELDFPAQSLSQSLYLDVRDPGPSNIAGYSMSGRPVEVVAVGETTKKNVNKFDSEFKISIYYDIDALYGGAEDDLTIFYYDEATNDWWPVQTTVDKKNHKLSANVNHLTVFDYKAASWQGARLPTIDQAQVSGNTGAATYDMSFWLPPSQGGFNPSLSMSYNSQVVDSSTAFTQAGWVGMGWSLDTGYIERNMHGTNSDITDDTYQLILNGVSNQLLPISISGTLTTYVTREMNYWQITFDSSTNIWTIKDQAGTSYVFGFQTRTNATTACVTADSGLTLTWRWSLSSATDKFNNTISYSYINKKKTDASTCLNEVAVYPTFITYPNNHYRVEFVLEAALRTDYQVAWEANTSAVFFQNRRLDKILIEQNPSGTTWNTIRQYDFTYSVTTTNQIYPDFRWTKGGTTAGLTSTLVGVQERSGDGTTNLPATQFTYADKMHLTQVNNGQGGTVTFTYERWTFLDDDNDDLWSLYTVFGQDECSSTVGTAWYAMTGYGTTKCEANMLQIDKRTASVGVGLRAFPQHIIKQGAQYRLYIQARNIYQTTGLEWGFTDPNNFRDVQGIATGIGTVLTDFEVGGEMAVNLNPLTTKFIIECSNCYIKKLQFMMMPLFYRVTSKVVNDSATSTSGTYTYSYNDGANNDGAHSEAATRVGTKYTPVLRDYRGYSQVQVKNPDGLVTTTWYYQNDLLVGRPYRTLTSTQDVMDEFKTLDATKWTFSHAGTRQKIGNNLEQESWLNSTTTAADWTTVTNRTAYSLTDGDVMYTQFNISGAYTQALLGIENSTGDFFGAFAIPNGTSHDLKTRVNINSTPVDTMLIPASTFKRDTWYEAMIFVDANDGFQLRVWEKYNPVNYFESSSSSPNGAVGWRFTDKVYNGTVMLDSYLEGVPYSETEMSYESSVLYDTLTNSIPNLVSLTSFVDLQVNRSTTSAAISRFFDGDYSWTGTKTTYEYNPADQGGTQYGNLTRTMESSWNGAGWSDYRASKVEYVPNATTNLTTLPARSITLDCASGCDFTGESGKTSEMLYLYDNAGSASSAPTTGVLTAQRSWVEDGNYAQAAYAYDTHGNPVTTTTWSGFGTATTSPTTSARTTTTAYDATYLTYPISVTNALNQATQTAYNYAIGQPSSVTDANNVTTSAQYDVFGRMVKIVAPGDSDASPTLTIAYHDTRIPFQVDLNQKVNSSEAAIRISRFYSGLGQQIQTQMVGSIVNGVQKNTVTDVKYDIAGRAIKETKPYTINYNGSPVFLAQTFTQALTQTTYDILSRPTSVTLPNGNSSSYGYNGLTTSVTDPANKVTVSYKDDWGRLIAIDAPTGPGLTYAYDSRNLLTSVQKGSGGSLTETVLTYNQAGQKTAMDDPDMGVWSYEYDALGNLVSQADARNCITSLSYDALNRLTGKSFSGAGACAATASISYTYDSGAYAIGQRSSMEDGSGSTAWTYDSRGRKSSEVKTIGSLGFTTSWTYNSADQPVTMTYPDGEVLTYGYNSQGLLNSLTNNESFTYLSSMNYDEAGRMTQMNLGSGSLLQKAFSYYSWSASVNGGNLSTMTTTNAASSTLQDFDYTYDMRGNIAQITDGVSSETSAFSYDDLSRLTAMNVTSGGTTVHAEAFTYDPGNGNLTGKGADLNSLVNYTYSASQPHALTAYGSNAYTYDANGNQVTRQIGSTEFDLTFDAENHLVQVQSNQPFPIEIYSGGPTITPSPTAAITETSIPTATETSTATLSPTPSDTPTITETPTPTNTLEPSPTVPTNTPTDTETPTETATIDPLITATETPSETATVDPLITATETMTPTITDTPTETFTPTITLTPSETPTPTETATETATSTPTETATATATATPIPGEALYVYDGDGTMVKSVIGDVTTYYAGSTYEKKVTGIEQVERKYYFAGSSRIAMRENGALTWLLSDNLGSTSTTAAADGSLLDTVKYTAFGEIRDGATATDYRYTGQRDEFEIGLYYYVARYYDPVVGRFISADTLIPQPGSSQAYDRFAYVNNNPINFNDPSGHRACDDFYGRGCNVIKPKIVPATQPAITSNTIPTKPTITPVKTPLPTPTGIPSSIDQALALLQYSKLGQDLFNAMKSQVPDVAFEYSPTTSSHGLSDSNHTMLINPRYSPARIAGTIAHESYHHLYPGNEGSLLEEYYAYAIGDIVRNDIIQAGYGNSSDLFFSLSVYDVDTNNKDRTQLSTDLKIWFREQGLSIYYVPKAEGGYGVQSLP